MYIYGTTLYHFDSVYRSRNKKYQGYYKTAGAAKNEAENVGRKFTPYWTFGKYDGIGILEAPNDEAAMEFRLRVGSLGDVR